MCPRVYLTPRPSALLVGVKALVLVPTRELCDQTREAIKSLTYYCSDLVSGACSLLPLRPVVCITLTHSTLCAVLDLCGAPLQEQIAKLKESPDIIIATPSRLVQHLTEGASFLPHLCVAPRVLLCE